MSCFCFTCFKMGARLSLDMCVHVCVCVCLCVRVCVCVHRSPYRTANIIMPAEGDHDLLHVADAEGFYK